MKKSIGLFMCLSILLVCACKKKSTAPAVITTRVGNVYDDSSHLSTLYFYSPTQLIRGNYDDSGKYNYSYHYLDGLSVTEVQLNGFPAYSVSYIWNAQSFADSSDQLDPLGNIVYRKNYTYNSSGYLTNVNWYNSVNTLVLTESFTISNGNITQHSYNAVDTGGADLPHGSYTYQYYSGQVNTLTNVYYGLPYMGTSSGNPVKSVIYTYGSIVNTTDYTYHYNNGLISSQLLFTDSSGIPDKQVDSVAYSYYID
jgi:hypothetical protein